MKVKTKKRVNLIVIWALVFVFAASGFLLYLPSGQGTPQPESNEVAPEVETVEIPASPPQP